LGPLFPGEEQPEHKSWPLTCIWCHNVGSAEQHLHTPTMPPQCTQVHLYLCLF
jgi:hypothetical protein